MSILKLRLKNCLETLLDLKPSMKENQRGFFEADFLVLQHCLEKADEMDLREEEVSTLETYASAFLTELANGEKWNLKKNNLQ